jgi:DNA (cytosine-5)-methyltransferase 1
MSPEARFQDTDQATTFTSTASVISTSQKYARAKAASRKGSKSVTLQQKQRYTFGDAFCGAGGTSRGAKSAGYHVEWGSTLILLPSLPIN